MATVKNTYQLDRETKNTLRYARTNDAGWQETIYVQKADLATKRPETVTVSVTWK